MSKKIIIIDILLLLLAILFCIFCANQPNKNITLVGAVILIVVVAFVMYSIYITFFYEESLETKIKKADKTNYYFKQEITKLLEQERRLSNRKSLFEESDSNDNLRDAYGMINEKVTANINTAVSFMNSYDYVAKPSKDYLNELVNENENLLNKLNTLIELNLKADNTSYLINTDSVEDLIVSLEQITKGGI